MTVSLQMWQSEDTTWMCWAGVTTSVPLIFTVEQHQSQWRLQAAAELPPYQLMDEYTGMSACSPADI